MVCISRPDIGPRPRREDIRPLLGHRLEQVGELDREFDAFADLAGADRIYAHGAQLVELAEQQPEMPADQLLAEREVLAGIRQIGIGDESGFGHDLNLGLQVAHPSNVVLLPCPGRSAA